VEGSVFDIEFDQNDDDEMRSNDQTTTTTRGRGSKGVVRSVILEDGRKLSCSSVVITTGFCIR